jgi:thymidylate synthase
MVHCAYFSCRMRYCGIGWPQAGEFVHVIGDAHVYLNHIEPLMEQLAR